jgi:hypothetical protein
VTEFLKNLWGKLYSWALPSALTLGAYWMFVYPETSIGHDLIDPASDTEKAAIFAALSVTIAFCLNAFSSQLYRVLEGYLLWPMWLQKLGVKRQLKHKRAAEKAAEKAVSGTGWMRGLKLEKLALYPLRDEQVVPTRFGNAIRWFETYGKTRFNLDSQTLWYELCAVAPKYIESELGNARSSVDFFVALFYLSAALGFAAFAVAAGEDFKRSILVICIAAFVVTWLCHWLVVRVTQEWGMAVQALVNIGRLKLADSLGLRLPESLAEEEEMWGLVTSYVFFGTPDKGVQLDRFRKKGGPKAAALTDADRLPTGGDQPEGDSQNEEGESEAQDDE